MNSKNNFSGNSSYKKIVFPVISIAVSIFFCLFVIEMYLHITGLFPTQGYRKSDIPGLGFEIIPSRHLKQYGHDIAINKQGYRDTNFLITKSPDSKRIVCLGDSMTMGYGIEKSSIYVDVLERSFRSSGKNYEFMNFSIGGYNTAQEWLVYKHRAADYKPDLVLVQFLLNDLTYTYPVNMSDGATANIKAFLAQRFHLYMLVSYAYHNLRENNNSNHVDLENMDSLNAPVGPEFMKDVYDINSKPFKEWKSIVAEFGKLRRSGVPVLFVIFPWDIYKGMDAGKPYPYYIYHDRIKAILNEEGIPYVDVTPMLTSYGNLKQFWVSEHDFHLNVKAHQLIADYLKSEIEKNIE